MKEKMLSLLVAILTVPALGQIGINTTTPSSATVLDIHSSSDNLTYGGLLPPRVNRLQRDQIPASSEDDGLLVFLSDGGVRCLQIWDGQTLSWENVHCLPYTGESPWINEVHYENEGVDVNEGIEIAGPAGMDLSDYRVVGYNGATGNFYQILVLSGFIDNESNGFGAVWFPFENMQNGSPDGLALEYIPTSQTVQLLSYEGTFVAGNGNSANQLSIDIGVNEPISTPLGNSLQLVGTGNRYLDFNWVGPVVESRGSLNTGQVID